MPSGGVDWDTVLAAMHAWVVVGTGLSDQKVVWGQQDSPRATAPSVVLRVSTLTDVGTSWLDYEDNPLEFDDLTVTADAGADTLTSASHARVTGDGPVRVTSTGTVPAGLDDETDYWIAVLDDDVMQVCASFRDAMAVPPVVVDLTGAGTGTITVVATDETVRAGEEIQAVARSQLMATLELRCHAAPVIGMNMAVALLQKVRSRREWPSQVALLDAAGIALLDVDRVIAMVGTRDDLLFEPRAHLNIKFGIPAEDAEVVTIIERVMVENEDTGEEFEVPASTVTNDSWSDGFSDGLGDYP